MLASAVFITCAVTGSGDAVKKNAHVPVTPEQIATSALEAHEAGAAVVHVHVRAPASGAPSRGPTLFRGVFERIRARHREVIVHLAGAMRDALPPGVHWSAFGVGRMQMPMVASAVLLGGNVRVGLEDNLYLEKGVPATNAQLVERAVRIVELLGARVQSSAEARQRLGLRR